MDTESLFLVCVIVITVVAILSIVLTFTVYCISIRYGKMPNVHTKSDVDLGQQTIKSELCVDLQNSEEDSEIRDKEK